MTRDELINEIIRIEKVEQSISSLRSTRDELEQESTEFLEQLYFEYTR